MFNDTKVGYLWIIEALPMAQNELMYTYEKHLQYNEFDKMVKQLKQPAKCIKHRRELWCARCKL